MICNITVCPSSMCTNTLLLILNVVKEPTVPTPGTHAQTPPMAPAGPHGPPLVPDGRWLHPVDARAEPEASSKRLRFPSMRWRKMSTMSTARLLRAAGSAQQSAEHAEAAGACSSEPCRCWSHGELRHDLARLSIPGDSLARPSVRPWGTFSCRSTTPRAHATNSCMGPVAAAGLPPAPSRSRAQPVGYPDPVVLLQC